MPPPSGTRGIAFVISSLGTGGSQRVLSRLASGFAGDGRAVRILTLDAATEPRFPLHPSIRIVRLDVTGSSRGLTAAIAANLARLVALRRALRSSRDEAVVAFGDKTGVLALLASLGTGKRVIVSERSNPFLNSPGLAWRLLRRWTYPRAHAVVALTERCAAYFRRLPNVRILPNGVPFPREAEDSLPRETEIIALGRLVPLKGFDLLVRAFARVREDLPGWRVSIWGEGEERIALERLIAELGVHDAVFLRGHARDPESLLKRAAIFALPSRLEGFPNALCEAMACGCAVIAADCETGPREIVTHGEDGILVPPEDIEALARALRDLARHPEKRASLGRLASGITRRFSEEAIRARWALLIEGKVLPPEPPRSRKILVVVPSLRRGGAERVVSHLSLEWARNHAVTVAVFNAADARYAHGGTLVNIGAGARSRFPPAQVVRLLWRIFLLWRLVRREDPDHLFGFTESANFPLLLAACLCGRRHRMLASVHNNMARMPWHRRLGIRLLYPLAGGVAPVSRGMGEQLVRDAGLKPAKVRVIYNPVPAGEAAARAEEPFPGSNPRYFLFVGRLAPQKDPFRLLEIFASLPHDGTELWLAGQGPQKAALEVRAAASDLAGRVRFLGDVENPFVYMRHALALLLTSKHEGFPMVLLEGLACGCPFIAFDCDFGPREIASEDEGGFLVSPGDDARFADRMRLLASDAPRRDRLAASARARVRAFDIHQIAAQWLEGA